MYELEDIKYIYVMATTTMVVFYDGGIWMSDDPRQVWGWV